MIYINMNEDNLESTVTNCTFTQSEQRIEYYSGQGYDRSTGSSITFNNCNFKDNSAVIDVEGGEISSCVILVEYIKSNVVTFNECSFDHYKGKIVYQGLDPQCNTYFKKCNFTNNEGNDGCAIYVAYPLQNPNYKMTIEDCIFKGNRGTGKNTTRGCVSVDTKCVTFVGNNKFIDNEIRQTESGNPNKDYLYAYRGSLFIRQVL